MGCEVDGGPCACLSPGTAELEPSYQQGCGSATTVWPSVPRHHGWLQPLWGPAGCAEIHPHGHHPGHRHHFCSLYPSGLGRVMG